MNEGDLRQGDTQAPFDLDLFLTEFLVGLEPATTQALSPLQPSASSRNVR